MDTFPRVPAFTCLNCVQVSLYIQIRYWSVHGTQLAKAIIITQIEFGVIYVTI